MTGGIQKSLRGGISFMSLATGKVRAVYPTSYNEKPKALAFSLNSQFLTICHTKSISIYDAAESLTGQV